jgi:putative FmdB family regulatory protein
MPTYEYECNACGHAFERFQSITAAPVKRCPECGKAKVKRLMGTGAGLIFKGSGFYITDYRSESYDQAKKSDAPATEAKNETKSESKPAETKAEAKPAAKAESKPAKPPKGKK